MEEFGVYVDESGHIVVPPELAKKYGLTPGTRSVLAKDHNGLLLRRPVTHLAKIYIEATNHCNLECVTCIRHSWDEPLGEMTSETFTRIIDGLKSLSSPPDIFFGGLGEPLSHPRIVDMVQQAKTLGSTVELITNGTLLNKSLAGALIDAGLDMLWVSLDGATPGSYKDVRLGAALPEVLANLGEFRRIRYARHYYAESLDLLLKPQLGIVFVAMKRNIAELPAVLQLANQLGSLHFLVTNVLPYTPEMQDEILYSRSLTSATYRNSPWLRYVDLPRMDISPATRDSFYQTMRGDHSLSIAGGNLRESGNRCPFIEKGAMSIRWDGDASPCLALLHNHQSYLYSYERAIKRHVVGNVMNQDMESIWNKPDYVALRNRLREFNFSPCIFCGGCDYFKSNQEDCIGSPMPACGGCLWAQGIIQCP